MKFICLWRLCRAVVPEPEDFPREIPIYRRLVFRRSAPKDQPAVSCKNHPSISNCASH